MELWRGGFRGICHDRQTLSDWFLLPKIMVESGRGSLVPLKVSPAGRLVVRGLPLMRLESVLW